MSVTIEDLARELERRLAAITPPLTVGAACAVFFDVASQPGRLRLCRLRCIFEISTIQIAMRFMKGKGLDYTTEGIELNIEVGPAAGDLDEDIAVDIFDDERRLSSKALVPKMRGALDDNATMRALVEFQVLETRVKVRRY